MRIAVLKGGRSLERQVSLRSAGRVQDALERLGHDVTPVDVGPDLVDRLTAAKPELAFVALHGRDGEDGTVQELLEVLGIPYTGSGVSACIRAADKVLAKHAMRDRGIPTPDFYSFSETAFQALGAAQALPEIEDRLQFPIVVKPATQGSALGIKFARTAADVPQALVAAFSYDRKVLLERYVAGRDLAVSIIEERGSAADGVGGGARDGGGGSARGGAGSRGARGAAGGAARGGAGSRGARGAAGGSDGGVAIPRALPIVEAVPQHEDFYDFESRYEIGRTKFVCPAELDGPVAARASELALAVYELLGCRGFGRVDLMLDSDGQELYVLEADPIPGLTETSLLPQAADAAGIGFDELVGRMVAAAG